LHLDHLGFFIFKLCLRTNALTISKVFLWNYFTEAQRWAVIYRLRVLNQNYFGDMSDFIITKGGRGFVHKALLIVPLAIIIFALVLRQPIVNITGLDRHILSGMHSILVSCVALYSLIYRIKAIYGVKRVSYIDLLVFPSMFVYLVLLIYYMDNLSLAQFAYALTLYIFVPMYIYFCGTPLWKNYRDVIIRILLIIFVFSFVVSVFQYFKIDMPLVFSTDDSVMTKETFYGTVRVNGLFGNFVNYAFISFVVFVFCYIKGVFEKNSVYLFISMIAFTSILMTSTRAYIFMAVAVMLYYAVRRINLKSFFILLIATVFFLTLNVEYIDAFMGVVMSDDKHSQGSNQLRIDQIIMLRDWFDQFTFQGLGAGFLFGPNEYKKQWVTDGYFIMLFLEVGFFIGILTSVLILFVMFSYLIKNYSFISKDAGVTSVSILMLSYIAVSLVNSAHADIPSSIIFTTIVGYALLYKRILVKKP